MVTMLLILARYVHFFSPPNDSLTHIDLQMCDGSFDFLCASYTDIVGSNVPKVYNNQTGIFKQNVDYFLDAIFKPFNDLGNCSRVFPKGIAGV